MFQPIGDAASRVVERIEEHRRRGDLRTRQAAATAKAAGGSAMDAALASIDRAFGQSAAIESFKLRVLDLIRLGAGHPSVRARFGRRVAGLRNDSIDGAIIRVERWYRTERKAFQVACALGRGDRLAIEILRELRLLLRLARATGRGDQFQALTAAVLGAETTLAAE